MFSAVRELELYQVVDVLGMKDNLSKSLICRSFSDQYIYIYMIYIYAPAFEPPPLPPKGHGTPLPPCGVVWGGLGLVVVVVVGVAVGLVVVVVVEVVVVLVVHDII